MLNLFKTLKTPPKEPLRVLPEDWTDKSICLHYTGGVGDVLMGVGGTAQALKARPCEITASVMPHQMSLMEMLPDIDYVEEVQRLNNPEVRGEFDIMLDFSGAIANSRMIKFGEYYNLFSSHVGIPIEPAKFSVPHVPRRRKNRKVVGIHTGASNPNRRWPESRFKLIADSLISAGYFVLWLGTCDEYGYLHEFAERASDVSEELSTQVSQVASCHYFIGNDSGFAHIAGLLGVPGLVIFSVTHPGDVIARYPTLHGVHSFQPEQGLVPTRSLRADDPIGFRNLSNVSVGQVLESLPFSVPLQERSDSRSHSKPVFVVYGDVARLEECLGDIFDFRDSSEYIDPETAPLGAIRTEESKIYVTTTFRTAQVAWGHPEVMRRALRELINA